MTSQQLPADRTDLITWFDPAVRQTVASFVNRNPNFRGVADDLLSVARIKLIEVVDRFLARTDKNPSYLSNYIRISVITGISDFIRDNSVIRAPKATWVPCVSLAYDPVDPLTGQEDPLTREAFEAACKDGTDKVVLEMALRGCNRKEIADTVCESQQSVRKRVKRLLRRAHND